MTPLLDLLDAATEARVNNPQLRPSVLASLRLGTSAGYLRFGRLTTFRHDSEIREIISQGECSVGDEEQLRITLEARDSHAVTSAGDLTAYPLGKGKRIHGV